jgi:hypothetical protein
MNNNNKRTIFVFGSNLAGIHGAGAALYAKVNYGAPYEKNVTARWGKRGQYGTGMQGNSYAIPTKDEWIKTMPLLSILPYIIEFIGYAKSHPELDFNVARLGCGLAGYKDEDMSPMFSGAPDNVYLHYHKKL